MAKKKSTGPKGPKKSLWAIVGLEKRCQELIESGALSHGSEKICQVINGEFAEKFEADGLRLTHRGLEARLPKLVWTSAVLESLKKAIRTGMSLEEFGKYYPYIPEKILKAKAKFLTGLTDSKATAEFLAGMGRLSTTDLPADAESFEFENNSYHHPYQVAVGKSEWLATVLNGTLIGIRHSRLIAENPGRRALSDAEKRGDAVVVVANTVCMDLKKAAGPIKVYRAQVSGLHVKVEHLPVSYRDEAGRILRTKPLDEVVFMPMSARFLAFLDAWDKITHRPDGTPEYTGTVVYPLGFYEEELINSAAYHEVRYIVIRKQQRLDAEVSFAKAQLTRAMHIAEGRSQKSKAFRWVQRCSARLDALIQQRAMTIITNVSEQDLERHRRRMRALLVRKLEEVIPGCKVVSQGSAYVEIGGKNVEFNIPGNAEVTDGTLASYVDEYGTKVFSDTMPRTVVICHPHGLNSRAVGRDDYTEGQRDSSMVYTAPICVDDVLLRQQLKHSTRAVHPISKMLKNGQFRTGVLVLRCVNDHITADSVPISKLDNGAQSKVPGYFPYPETKHIWVKVASDLHFGSRSREHILDEQNERWLGVAEVSMEMMRREGLFTSDANPLHLLTVNDDVTQGNHFDTHKQPDPREMSVADLEARGRRAKAEAELLAKEGDSGGLLKLVVGLGRFSLAHRLIQGEDWAQPQMLEVFTRLIDPNLDFFDTLLSNTRRSKLAFRGLSEINGAEFDARDVGAISFGTGNHIEKTVERNLTEGVFYAYYLKALLGGKPRWRRDHSFLERHVKAPLEGNAYFGEGTVKAPGGYEWGINFMSSPARLKSWADPTGAVVNNDRHRGDPFGHMKGRVTLRTYGDKHFFSWCVTPYSIYAMCAAHTHTDRYGHHGFPPNNTGVLFIGLPAGGPDDGPVLFRTLRYDFLRDYMKKPRPFDWKKFLPNPL